MSAREWQPGDVALVEAGCWANRKVALRLAEGWAHTNGVNMDGDGVVDAIRPLAVIDPESLGDRDRLCTPRLREEIEARLRVGINDRQWNGVMVAMQAALREFANPTPPKPDEPTGLGAVIEDADGIKWLCNRFDPAIPWSKPWFSSDLDDWRDYSDIAAVRILSEGVPS